MAAPLRIVCASALRQTARPFSSTCVTHAGKKWRLESADYLNIVNIDQVIPSMDGRPAPPLKGQVRRRNEREEFARRAVYLNAEVDIGMDTWKAKKEEEQRRKEELKTSMLKPKGKLLLKKKN
uniref:Large ribosomal subunit protein mL52 n=1 Tax=Astyanax mexicanus TaxID=7994 RepID=A0A8B9JNU8_ASTMX